MAYEFKFPDVGEGITEGEIVKWRVKTGDKVKKDQIIADVETDKAVAEIPSPAAGKIQKINFKEGETVNVGDVLVVIDDGSATTKKIEEPVKTEVKEEVKKVEVEKERKSVGVVGELEEASEVGSKKVEINSSINIEKPKVRATLLVRKLAETLGIDLTKVKGTGNNGLITEEDIKKASKGGGLSKSTTNVVEKKEVKESSKGVKSTRKYDFYGYLERIPLKGVRKVIAKNMRNAVDRAAHVTHIDEADITELSKVRDVEKVTAEKKGVKLTFLPYIVKACINALKKHPYLNAMLDEETQEIILKKYYNIGIAVDTENGLVVPVVKMAEKRSVIDIGKEIFSLAKKAKSRKLDIADMKGGTFTITNIGSIGGLFATPIVNFPEVAILGLGRGYDKAVVINNEVKIRKVLPFSLSFDHRVLDGAEAARFGNDLKEELLKFK